jgi:hypothetical protein
MKARLVLLAVLVLTLATPLVALPTPPEKPALCTASASPDAPDAIFQTGWEEEPLPCDEVCCFPTAPGNTFCYIGVEVKSCWYYWQYYTCEIR